MTPWWKRGWHENTDALAHIDKEMDEVMREIMARDRAGMSTDTKQRELEGRLDVLIKQGTEELRRHGASRFRPELLRSRIFCVH